MDYADKANGGRSVSSVAVMSGGTAVNASSTTQHCVTLSTSEAECRTMAQGVKTVLLTRVVLEFLQPQFVGRVIVLFKDNQGYHLHGGEPDQRGTHESHRGYHLFRC